MSLANVALTDTFDYWRTTTNSLVVALNDKLIFCNTSNANTVSIPSFASRTSNLYINIITSSSVNDAASGNVASALVVNTVHGLALSYAAAANSNTQTSVSSVNTYVSILAANNAVGANNWANTKLSNTSGVSFAGNLYFPAGVLAVGSTLTSAPFSVSSASANPLAILNATGTQDNALWFTRNNDARWYIYNDNTNNGFYIGNPYVNPVAYFSNTGSVGIGTTSPAATLDVVGTVNISKANVLNQTLTDGATINWNTALGAVATVTLGGNRTMAAPSNLKVGTYILHVVQDGSGGRTISWNSVFKWPAGIAPTLTSTANRRDLFSFVCDGTNLYGSFLPDVR